MPRREDYYGTDPQKMWEWTRQPRHHQVLLEDALPPLLLEVRSLPTPPLSHTVERGGRVRNPEHAHLVLVELHRRKTSQVIHVASASHHQARTEFPPSALGEPAPQARRYASQPPPVRGYLLTLQRASHDRVATGVQSRLATRINHLRRLHIGQLTSPRADATLAL